MLVQKKKVKKVNSKQAKEFIKALDGIVAEKGIDKKVVIEAMEAAMANAYKKNTGITNVKATVMMKMVK